MYFYFISIIFCVRENSGNYKALHLIYFGELQRDEQD